MAHDERLSVSSVPTSRPLPPEFSHPALQELLRLGSTRGSVGAAAVRTACEEAAVPMARMRNLLVHHYADVSVERVHEIIRTRLGDFDRFAAQITSYADRS